MGKVAITESLLDDLADAIGSKASEPTPMTLTEMTNAVYNIPAPSGTITITQNDTYDVASYEFAEVNVAGGGGSSIHQDSNGYIVLPAEEGDGILIQDADGYIIIPRDKWGPIPSNYGLITWNGVVLMVS